MNLKKKKKETTVNNETAHGRPDFPWTVLSYMLRDMAAFIAAGSKVLCLPSIIVLYISICSSAFCKCSC